MKNYHKMTLSLLIATALLTGCKLFSQNIRGEAVQDSVEILVERHDTYVLADEDLTEEARADYVGQAVQLKTVAGQQEIPTRTFKLALDPVADRHDEYVREDGTLSELEERTYLRTSQELRGLVD